MILKRDEPFAQLVVPDHKEIDKGTLRAILRQSNLSVGDFQKLLSGSAVTHQRTVAAFAATFASSSCGSVA
jgi:hypothetical protein